MNGFFLPFKLISNTLLLSLLGTSLGLPIAFNFNSALSFEILDHLLLHHVFLVALLPLGGLVVSLFLLFVRLEA